MQQDIRAGTSTGTAPGTMAADLARIQMLARAPVAGENDLKLNLANIYRELYLADFAKYDLVAVRMMAASTMQALFELRLYLRGEIPGWARRGFMSHDVQKALRDVFRVTRYASDMLGELNIAHDKLPPGAKTRRGFTGDDLNVLVNPAFQTGGDLPFRSGDVIVVRGQAHNSAAIARIGDVDSQFSHIGIVHIDPDLMDVLVYKRGPDGQWDVERLEVPEGLVTVSDTPVALALSAIYSGVPLAAAGVVGPA